MKVKYHWPETVTRRQRSLMVLMLLDQMEQQQWSAIVYLKLWKTFGLVCIQ